MKTRGRMSAFLGVALAGLALAAPALAQGPPPGGGPGGFGGGPGGFGGGPGGNGGPGGGFGRQRRAPFTVGTVASVDANAGTITITTQAGATQTINVDSTVHLVTQTTLNVSDLKVGDTVAVQGVPTGITASQITVGTPPAGLPGGGGFGGGPRGGNGGPGAAAGGPAAGGAGGATQSFATATGTVKALPTKADPHLAISLGADVQMFLKVADGAKITRWGTVTLDALKAGDRIIAAGQTGADGTLTASAVGVNLPQGQGGFGGGGFGGPGGRFGGGPGPNAQFGGGGGGFGGPPPGGGPPPDGGPPGGGPPPDGGPPPGQ